MVRAGTGHQETVLEQTSHFVPTFVAEATVDSAESRCDTHVHRRGEFLDSLLLSLPPLLAVSSPLPVDFETRSLPGFL